MQVLPGLGRNVAFLLDLQDLTLARLCRRDSPMNGLIQRFDRRVEANRFAVQADRNRQLSHPVTDLALFFRSDLKPVTWKRHYIAR
jgi:hypothetical protein